MEQRYKQRGLQFNSSADSRALRAVNNQERQRTKRNNVISQRRQLDESLDTERLSQCRALLAAASSDAQPHKTKQELGVERYQELLKWKEGKKKKLMMEKKRRKPSFKTGVYHPQQPKFLTSGDLNQLKPETPGKNTPLKYSRMSTTEKKKVPIFRPGGTPSSALPRVPQFHTGVTPSVATKSKAARGLENFDPARNTRDATKKFRQADNDGGRSNSSRTRLARHRKVHMNDLGVQPLPVTPQVAQSYTPTRTRLKPKKVQTSVQSFAPHDFAFNFEFLKKPIATLESLDPCKVPVEDSNTSESVDKKSVEEYPSEEGQRESNHEDVEVEVKVGGVVPDDDASEYLNKKSLVNEILGEEHLEELPSERGQTEPNHEDMEGAANDVISEVPDENDNDTENLDKQNLINEMAREAALEEDSSEENQSKFNQDMGEGKGVIGEEQCLPQDANDVEAELSDRVKGRRSFAVTPRKHIAKRSSACCFSDLVTPIISRLRPRTPCSRNTRRSQSAHCDTPCDLYMHTSAKKSSRKSVTSSAKKKHVRGIQAENTVPRLTFTDSSNFSRKEEKTEVTFATPVSSGLEEKFWKVEASPWIDNCRRSAKKKCATPDFQNLPDFNSHDGSPLPAPIPPLLLRNPMSTNPEEATHSTTAITPKDNACINLNAFLEPSALEDAYSPKIDVWGSDSPSVNPETYVEATTPLTTRQSPPATVMSPKSPRDSAGKENSPPALPVQAQANGKKIGGRRSSRRSVMFAIEETEDETTSVRFPGTPVRASVRMSMGSFGSADVNEERFLSPGQDLIAFDSSISERETKATKGRKSGRMSSRVSLLPVLALSPTNVNELQVTEDLISWDSPAAPTQVEKLKTPVRRSRRLSKLPVV